MNPSSPVNLHGKRLAFALFSNQLSGAEKRFCRIFKALRTLGLDVHLILNPELLTLVKSNSELGPWYVEVASGNHIHQIKQARAGLLLNVVLRSLRMHRLLAVIRPDYLHTLLSGGQFWFIGPRKFKWSFEITSPDVVDLYASWKFNPFRFQYDKIRCVSPSVERRLMAKPRFQGDSDFRRKVLTAAIPFFLKPNLETYPETKADREKLIIYACRLIRRKNAHVFAEAAAGFLKQNPDWRVLICGKGPMETEIQGIISQHNLDERMQIRHYPNIYPVLLRSRLFVSVIEPDNYPSQSVLEAMACGNALLLSNLGDSGRFLDGTNGRLVAIDSEAIRREMTAMTANQSKLAMMGERSKVVLEEKFSATSYIREFIHFINATAL